LSLRYWPDTCPCCVITKNQPGKSIYEDWEHKCEIHKKHSSQDLIDNIYNHNISFKYPAGGTKEEIQDYKKKKSDEYKRIKKLGKGISNTKSVN